MDRWVRVLVTIALADAAAAAFHAHGPWYAWALLGGLCGFVAGRD